MAMQQVLVDSTDTLIAYPPFEIEGRTCGVPSSASVRIGTPSTTIPAVGSEEAATVDAVNANTNAAADRGATSLVFASGPSTTAGRRYLLTLTTGERVIVRVQRESGSTVYLASPLPVAAPSGSTLAGIAITHALVAGETTQRGESVAEWRATIDGVVRRWATRFEIVRQIFQIPLDAETLIQRAPDVLRLRSSNDLALDEIIRSAWLDYVRPELQAQGYHEERIRNGEALTPALIDAVRCSLITRAKETDLAARQAYDEAWRRKLQAIITGSAFWYDAEPSTFSRETDRGPDSYVGLRKSR